MNEVYLSSDGGRLSIPAPNWVKTQFDIRSFMESIVSTVEGFRITTSIKCHSERSDESLLMRLLLKAYTGGRT